MVASFSIRSLNVRYTRVTTYHNYKNYRERYEIVEIYTVIRNTRGGLSGCRHWNRRRTKNRRQIHSFR